MELRVSPRTGEVTRELSGVPPADPGEPTCLDLTQAGLDVGRRRRLFGHAGIDLFENLIRHALRDRPAVVVCRDVPEPAVEGFEGSVDQTAACRTVLIELLLFRRRLE